MKTKWLVACGMRRSGSTLIYHLCKDVVESVGGYDLGWLPWQDFTDAYDYYNGRYEYISLKSHVYMPAFSEPFARMWSRDDGFGIFIHRDVRDILASLIRHYKANDGHDALTIPNLAQDMRAITLLEGKRWFTTKNIYKIRYEDILDEDGIFRAVMGIASGIGLTGGEYIAREIARSRMLDKQRERLPSSGYSKEHHMWHSHIFTGRNGAWKDELSPQHISMCDQVERALPAEMRRR